MFRATVSSRIAERSHLLWNRNATHAEWHQFLQEAVYGKPITHLHANHPAPPLTHAGVPFPKA